MLPTSRARSLLFQGTARDCMIQQLSRQTALRKAGTFQIRNFTSPHPFLRARLQPRVSSSTPQSWRVSPFRRIRGSRYSSNTTKPPTQETGSAPSLSLSQRFKELSRKYGWAAVGVYFGLSALDFPFCYLAVRLLGTDRIATAEHFVVENFWKLVSAVGLDMRQDKKVAVEDLPVSGTAAGVQAAESVAEGHGRHHENASIWTQLLLAYGVHKSLIFFRVPLTAAVTPKIVKWLRARGWNIGRPKVQAPNTTSK